MKLPQLFHYFLLYFIIAGHCLIADDYVDVIDGKSVGEFRGYYKREHSLIKPYQGLN